MNYARYFCILSFIGLFATNVAIAATSPVERVCSSTMETMISYRKSARNGVSKGKLIEMATRKINQNLSDKDNEFLSSSYLWAIRNSELSEGEFRYDGNMHCYLEYDRLKM